LPHLLLVTSDTEKFVEPVPAHVIVTGTTSSLFATVTLVSAFITWPLSVYEAVIVTTQPSVGVVPSHFICLFVPSQDIP
jgi:hypothetical protein